jgi:uncharacterized protein (TIGR02231 family)
MQIEAPIREVSVYTDRALVARRGQVTLKPGVNELTIENIPTTLVAESVRAAGKGQALILGLEVSTHYHTEAPEEKLADLDHEIEQHEDQDKVLQDRLSTLESQIGFLQGLAQSSERLARGIGLGRVGVDECRNVLQFVAGGLDEARNEQQEIATKRRELARELEVLRQRRKDLVAPRQPQERRRITVSVEAQEETSFQLEVDYVVRNASWQPLYDLRLVGEQVAVTYRGQVTQRTGEPWDAVALTLSTAKPSVSAVLPELDPWYLDAYRPVARKARPGLARMAAPATTVAVADAVTGAEQEDAFAEVAVPPPPAPVAQAAVEQAGATVVYRIARPADVPPDGTAQKVTVAVLDLPAKLDHVTAPKLVDQAYLRATVTNDTDYVLLPGSASIFHESDFVGTTRLETVAKGQEFETFLGADDSIRVERELADREVDKTLIGNTRRQTYGYKIELENLRDQEAHVEVYDQLPVPRHESIKVKLLRANVEPEEEDLGILKWDLTLATQEKQELRFSFQVEYPRDMTVMGLPD